MIEDVHLELCDGCNFCIDSCPTDVLRLMEAGKHRRLSRGPGKQLSFTRMTAIAAGCAQSIATLMQSG